ncbi:MAG: hypothetical protein MPJ50_03325 [Pirellulales bacterium]|nr:hypothetical protein [Pirellulales bacterium]
MANLEERRHVVIAVNPFAGAVSQSGDISDLQALLKAAGLFPEVMTDLKEISARAIELHCTDKLRALVGVGGDGTMAELLNRTPPRLPLAMLPRGTENLMGKFLGQNKATAEKVAETLIHGRSVCLDVARITVTRGPASNGSSRGHDHADMSARTSRLFFLMAGFGFDADVVRRLQLARSGHIRHWSYLKPIVQSLRSYQYPEMQISCLDASGVEQTRVAARWFFIFNCPAYGGGLKISPQADCRDGLLDYCTFRGGSAAKGIKYLTMVLTGLHHRSADVTSGKAAQFRVETDGEVPIQIDGDPFGFAPAEIECCPQRMTILAPRDFHFATS